MEIRPLSTVNELKKRNNKLKNYMQIIMSSILQILQDTDFKVLLLLFTVLTS